MAADTEILICSKGATYAHEWEREKKRGVKPLVCPEHQEHKPASNGLAKARAAKAAKAKAREEEKRQGRKDQLIRLRESEGDIYKQYEDALDKACNSRTRDSKRLAKLWNIADQHQSRALQTTATIRRLEEEFPNV